MSNTKGQRRNPWLKKAIQVSARLFTAKSGTEQKYLLQQDSPPSFVSRLYQECGIGVLRLKILPISCANSPCIFLHQRLRLLNCRRRYLIKANTIHQGQNCANHLEPVTTRKAGNAFCACQCTRVQARIQHFRVPDKNLGARGGRSAPF